MVTAEPAVAEAFLRLRAAEAQEQRRLADARAEQRANKRRLDEVSSQRDAALADLKRHKKAIQDLENLQACKHAFKTWTTDVLGAGCKKAGGSKAKQKRMDVLDRIAALRAGLSPGQRNDW